MLWSWLSVLAGENLVTPVEGGSVRAITPIASVTTYQLPAISTAIAVAVPMVGQMENLS